MPIEDDCALVESKMLFFLFVASRKQNPKISPVEISLLAFFLVLVCELDSRDYLITQFLWIYFWFLFYPML